MPMIDTVKNKPNQWWTIAKISLAVVLVGFVFSKTDFQEFSNLLRQISQFWLGIYIVLFLSLTLLKTWQYHVLIGRGVSYTKVLGVIITQNVLTNFLATTAGIASYIAMFRAEHGVKIRSSVAIFVLVKIGDLCALWLGLIISGVLVWQKISAVHYLILVLIIGIGLALLCLLLIVFFRQKSMIYLDLFLSRSGFSKINLIKKVFTNLQALSETGDEQIKRTFIKVLLPSMIYFCFSILWIFAGYRVFNFQPGFGSIFFISTLIQIVSYLPVQVFGGLGVTETSSLYFWSLFAVDQSQLASILIGNRILFYLLNLLPLIYLPIQALFSGASPDPQKNQNGQ